MQLNKLALQNFRNYPKDTFSFENMTTVIVGPNTAGKTNLLEAVSLLANGKSFKAEKDTEMVMFDREIARVKGEIVDDRVREVVIAKHDRQGREGMMRRYLVNNLPKRRVDFASNFQALLFSPSHLDIIVGSPGLRRNFFNEVLEPSDREYRLSISAYEKALRARNALLHSVREGRRRDEGAFEYWDGLLVKHGEVITSKRTEFTKYINQFTKDLMDFEVVYDSSEMSYDRLSQYKSAEEASGMTLVGPQRDDFLIYLDGNQKREAKNYGSRGQQRLVVLQLKLAQLSYMEQALGHLPVLLLDDIFSELDDEHIGEVMTIVGRQQTIITTTHKEFLKKMPTKTGVLELEQAK